MDIALARPELERLQKTACIIITGAMRTTPTKVLEMFLDLPSLGTAVELLVEILWPIRPLILKFLDDRKPIFETLQKKYKVIS